MKKMTQSSELTGGAGFVYEGHVAAYFLAALLTRENRPPLNTSIKSVALQQSAYGAPLDDIIITFDDVFESKLHIQIKRSLTISAAATNKDFREIVKNSWLTYKSITNHHGQDYYGAITDTISSASLRNVRTVCMAARYSHNDAVFFSRDNESGTSSIEFEGFIEDIREILGSAQINFTDFDLHNFLKNFVILNLDIMTPESTSNSETINRLSQIMITPSRAHDLWERLKNISRDGAGISATYDHESLKRLLYPLFKFKNHDSQVDTELVTHHTDQPILDRVSPVNCSVAISNIVVKNNPVTLTAIIVTDDPNKLAQEVRAWKDKLMRSSLLTSDDKTLVKEKPLKTLVKNFKFAHILLQELITADFSAYVYYARGAEINDWTPEKLEREVAIIPLFHRLSNKNEVTETVYSEITNIGSIVASAAMEVKKRYHRSINSTTSTSYARNRKEILELSDLVAEICANYISDGPTYPKEYIAFIKTRIRYGENIATGEKHKRDKNPIA